MSLMCYALFRQRTTVELSAKPKPRFKTDQTQTTDRSAELSNKNAQELAKEPFALAIELALHSGGLVDTHFSADMWEQVGNVETCRREGTGEESIKKRHGA